jgi:hypothetical protein
VILPFLLCTLPSSIVVCCRWLLNITNASMLKSALRSTLLHYDCCIPHTTSRMDLEFKFQNI